MRPIVYSAYIEHVERAGHIAIWVLSSKTILLKATPLYASVWCTTCDHALKTSSVMFLHYWNLVNLISYLFVNFVTFLVFTERKCQICDITVLSKLTKTQSKRIRIVFLSCRLCELYLHRSRPPLPSQRRFPKDKMPASSSGHPMGLIHSILSNKPQEFLRWRLMDFSGASCGNSRARSFSVPSASHASFV